MLKLLESIYSTAKYQIARIKAEPGEARKRYRHRTAIFFLYALGKRGVTVK